MLAAGVIGSLAIASAIGLLGTSSWLISRAAQRPPVLELEVAIVIVRTCGLGRGVLRYFERLSGHDAAFRGLVELRVSVYQRLAALAPAGLADHRRGDLMSRLVSDVDGAVDLPLRVWLPAGAGLLAGLGTVAVITVLLPAVGLLLALLLLLSGTVVPALTAATASRSERDVAPLRGRLAAGVVDTLAGSADVVALGAIPAALDQLALDDAKLTAAARSNAAGTGLGVGLNGLLMAAAVVGGLAIGTHAVANHGLSGVDLAVLALVPLAAWETVSGLPTAALALARLKSGAQRVFAVVDAQLPISDPASPLPLPDGRGLIQLRGLRARWPSAPDWTVQDIDLDLAPGARVVVTGPSGAGKSTLAAALVRFVPFEGSYTIDGVSAQRLTGDDVRRVVALCASDSHVFDSSVAENLLLARRDASDADLQDVLRRTGLAEWVASLPEGIATHVGAHGSRLSGGQRQRLAVARALLARVPVLLLDEPTEHLDPANAAALMHDLLAATQERTTVIVTHRLVGLSEVDEVVVLSQGRVLERGKPERLRAAGGWYADRLVREEMAIR